MTITYRRSRPEDVEQIRGFWREHWCDDFMVVHGAIYRPEDLEGVIAMDGSEWVGLITYTSNADGCEIISLDSLREGQGIGSRLIENMVEEARRAGYQRIFVSTTNDNLEALGFYQKRGFRLLRVSPGAVDEARKIKPRISLIGMHGIPLRDEIELELPLGQAKAGT